MPLLSVDEALACLRSRARCHGRIERHSLGDLSGLALATSIVAKEPHPRFDNSAVDGYAVTVGERLKLVGAVMAGETWASPLAPGTCVRITTGAPIPPGTFAVVMQEDVVISEDSIEIKFPVQEGAHIRRAGTDFLAGTELLRSGQTLGPGSLALLASQGFSEASAFMPPYVGIVTTGDEVVDLHETPGPGQLWDSNGPMLEAMAFQSEIFQISRLHARDDATDLRTVLQAASGADVLVLAGGASVGDRDYVPSVVAELGEVLFHGVAMRPGKPVLFGEIGSCLVFGLPGNPASAFVCFELFVREAIRLVSGHASAAPTWVSLPFHEDHAASGRENFIRVSIQPDGVYPVAEQGSFGLASLAAASGLARLSASADIRKGDVVPVLVLPSVN